MDINEAVDLIAAYYEAKERELLKTILQLKIELAVLKDRLDSEKDDGKDKQESLGINLE